jgi:biopolymer transport protein ExbD
MSLLGLARGSSRPAKPTMCSVSERETALPLDLPKASELVTVQTIFVVPVRANGDIRIDGQPVTSDSAIVELARGAVAKNPDLRAVINADKSIAYGAIIHLLDLLRQGGIQKIAFGVVLAT